jgi:site-specific recombinase XerD
MVTDPKILQDFAQSLSSKDPKTVKAYLSALRGFVQWLSEKPGGDPFVSEAVTETAINSYLEYLKAQGRAARTRSQALTALRRFCRWAIGEGYMTRNPANQVQRPTVVNTAPRELTLEQRYVLQESGRSRTISHDCRLFLRLVIGLGYASAKWPSYA